MVAALWAVGLRMWVSQRFVVLFFSIVTLSATAQAVTQDWDEVTRTAGLGPISLSAVREIDPAWSILASCLLATALILRHRANLRK
jgi:hypothetical protein